MNRRNPLTLWRAIRLIWWSMLQGHKLDEVYSTVQYGSIYRGALEITLTIDQFPGTPYEQTPEGALIPIWWRRIIRSK